MVDVVERDRFGVGFGGDNIDRLKLGESVANGRRRHVGFDPGLELANRKKRPIGCQHRFDDMGLGQRVVEVAVDPLVDPLR